MKRYTSILIVMLLIGSILCFSGCQEPAKPSASPAASAAATTAAVEKPTAAATTPAAETTAPAKEEGPIKIGLIVPQSGYGADFGSNILKGTEYAVKVINEAGGVKGRKLELVVEDEGSEQQTSINGMMKLLNTPGLSLILGSSSSSFGIAVADQVSQYKIPTIMGGSSVTLAQLKNPWIWQTRMTDDLKGVLFAKTLVDRLQCKKPAIVYYTDAAGTSTQAGIESALSSKYNIKPSLVLGYDATSETNYSPYILKVIESGADSLILGGQNTDSALIMKACSDLGFKGPKIGVSASVNDATLKMAGKAAEGWYCVSDWANESDDAAHNAFVKGYTEYAKKAPVWSAAVYYDSVFLACKAIEIAGSSDPIAINEAFKKVENLKGVSSTLTYNDMHSFANTNFLCQVVDGKIKVVDTVER